MQRDFTCDSSYMSTAVHRVGEAMWFTYYWVAMTTLLYLVLDNAGGHGKDACASEYIDIPKGE